MPSGMKASRERRGLLCVVGVLILLSTSFFLAMTGIAGAISSGDQIQAAVAQAPFTAGSPFASGQTITVSVPANTFLPRLQHVNILECAAAPDGSPPTGTPQCDNNTQYGATVVPSQSDGSITVTDVQVYALPSNALGETASNATVCGGSTDPCILYIGDDQTNIGLPHVWSQGFAVLQTDAKETGTVNPGDGTIPSSASTPDPSLST